MFRTEVVEKNVQCNLTIFEVITRKCADAPELLRYAYFCSLWRSWQAHVLLNVRSPEDRFGRSGSHGGNCVVTQPCVTEGHIASILACRLLVLVFSLLSLF
jgi:hypothetical protein